MARGLELFAGMGGSVKGYMMAGHQMTGVDHRPMHAFPKGAEFVQADYRDVLENREDWVRSFDFIHAGPPCQIWSATRHIGGAKQNQKGKVDELTPLLEIIYRKYADMKWIIENVEHCPLESLDTQTIILCGSMFPQLRGLYQPNRQLRRHRKFRFHNFIVPPLACQHNGLKALGVYGSSSDPGAHNSGEVAYDLDEGRRLMGINWMSWRALKEAIPPPYTEYIGRHIPC